MCHVSRSSGSLFKLCVKGQNNKEDAMWDSGPCSRIRWAPAPIILSDRCLIWIGLNNPIDVELELRAPVNGFKFVTQIQLFSKKVQGKILGFGHRVHICSHTFGLISSGFHI